MGRQFGRLLGGTVIIETVFACPGMGRVIVEAIGFPELQVVQFIPIVIVPQALLAGIFWSIDALPGPLQPLARLMPLTYAIDGLREVLVKGSGLDVPALQSDLAVLAIVAVGLIVLAASTIRREIA